MANVCNNKQKLEREGEGRGGAHACPPREFKFRLDSTNIWVVYCLVNRKDPLHTTSTFDPNMNKTNYQYCTYLMGCGNFHKRVSLYHSHDITWTSFHINNRHSKNIIRKSTLPQSVGL